MRITNIGFVSNQNETSFPCTQVADNVIIRNEQEVREYTMAVKELVGSIVKGIEQMKS